MKLVLSRLGEPVLTAFNQLRGGGGLGPECNTLNATTRVGIVALISVVIENECRQRVCSKVDGNGQMLTGEFVVSAVVAECVFKDLSEFNPERHSGTTCTTAVSGKLLPLLCSLHLPLFSLPFV